MRCSMERAVGHGGYITRQVLEAIRMLSHEFTGDRLWDGKQHQGPHKLLWIGAALVHSADPLGLAHLYDLTDGCTSSKTSGSLCSAGGWPKPLNSHAPT